MMIPGARSSPDKQPDRRRHIRYHVNGSLELGVGEKVCTAIPVNLSLGGVLLKAAEVPPEGTTGTMRLDIKGFDERIVAKARIIRTHETVAAASFLSSPAALVRCVAWLAHKEREKQAIADT